MDNYKDKSLPNYIKYFYITGSIVLTCFIIISINFILSPLLAAAIVAILLTPLTNWLEKFSLGRFLSTMLSVLLFILGVFIIFAFITLQFSFIAADPSFSIDSINKMMGNVQNTFSAITGISNQTIRFNIDKFLNGLAPYFSGVIIVTANYITMFVLFFISLFFFIYYRTFFLSFIYKLFDESNHDRIKKTIEKIIVAVKNYIGGLFIVISTVALLNSMGLLILGINHAIFFGVSTAILTIIPYVGIMIGAIITAFYVLIISNSLWYAGGVIIIYSFVQFLEGNFITPNVIGHTENINPYVAILGLFIGGILLGAIGIILAIPILGIIKIICEDYQQLKPLSYVMGNPHKNQIKFQNIFNKTIDKAKKLLQKFKGNHK